MRNKKTHFRNAKVVLPREHAETKQPGMKALWEGEKMSQNVVPAKYLNEDCCLINTLKRQVFTTHGLKGNMILQLTA